MILDIGPPWRDSSQSMALKWNALGVAAFLDNPWKTGLGQGFWIY